MSAGNVLANVPSRYRIVGLQLAACAFWSENFSAKKTA
jgi:hypothetical protein